MPIALYAGTVADGRSWKYPAPVKPWAASFDPTVVPFTRIRLPFAVSLKATWAMPVMTTG